MKGKTIAELPRTSPSVGDKAPLPFQTNTNREMAVATLTDSSASQVDDPWKVVIGLQEDSPDKEANDLRIMCKGISKTVSTALSHSYKYGVEVE